MLNKQRKALFILLIITILLPFALSALKLNNPNQTDVMAKFQKASVKYPFGTDHLGRCEFSRLISAGKTTITIVVQASFIIFILGTGMGLILTALKNAPRIVLLSILNAINAIPPIVYLIIFIGAFGNGKRVVLFSLCISLTLRAIKYVYSLAKEELKKAYVISARCMGASKARLLFVHILPNIFINIIGFISLSCAEIIALISGFSYIGINLGDEIIDWGLMINEGRQVIHTAPKFVIFPTLIIVFYTFVFNKVSEILKLGEEIEA